MALETATFINGLVATNPTGSDPISSGDDHLRLIKATILNTFPNITGAVTKTHTQINDGLEKSGGTMTGPLVLSGAPTSDLNPATKKYVDDSDALKANKAVTISAGAGLTGGGDLSANRSLAIADGGVTAAKLAAGAAVGNIGFTPVDAAAFVQSLGNNGYQKLPSGLIIQWGSASWDTAVGTKAITFPTAFSTACHVAMGILANSGGFVIELRSKSTSGCTFGVSVPSGTSATNTTVYWFAVGV